MATTQTFSVKWGAFEIGGASAGVRHLRYPIRFGRAFQQDSKSAFVSFQVAVMGADQATFLANCLEFEDEMASRRRRIQVLGNGVTMQDWDPAGLTNATLGFNQHATVEKVGTPGADSLRSRVYDVTLSAELPYDDTEGRGETVVSVDEDAAGLRTVTIRGKWSAVAGKTAYEQYRAKIDAHATSVLATIDGAVTWERTHDHADIDDQDKMLTFDRVYREKQHAQSLAGIDDPNIVEETLSFQLITPSPGDSGRGIKRISQVIATYVASVKKDAAINRETIYEETIKPYIVSEFLRKHAPSQFGIVNQIVDVQESDSGIYILVMFDAAIDPTDVVESVVTQRIVEKSGTVFTNAWTGGLFDKYVDFAHAERLRFSIRAVTILGVKKPKQRVGGGGKLIGAEFSGGGEVSPDGKFTPDGFFDSLTQAGRERASGGGGGGGGPWYLIENDSAATVIWRGEPGDDQFATTLLVETVVEAYADKPSGSGGGRGGINPGGGTPVVGIGGSST